MKLLTVLTFMSGAGGHSIARFLFENNSKYRWSNHPRNDAKNNTRFTKLNITENHFQKTFSDGSKFPHLFDRIEPFLNNVELYYNTIESEIYDCTKGKRLVYTCHTDPKSIKERYPDCLVYQILPTEENKLEYFNRHMETAMLFPLQTNIHKMDNRQDLLNADYWERENYVKHNKSHLNSLKEFYMHKGFTKEQLYQKEYNEQTELYDIHMSTTSYADETIIFSSKQDLKNKIEILKEKT